MHTSQPTRPIWPGPPIGTPCPSLILPCDIVLLMTIYSFYIYDFLNKARGRLLFVLNMGDPIRLMQ